MMVFVYGSLKNGLSNHHILDGATYIGQGWTAPNFTMLNLGWFPGVVLGGTSQIEGELYEVDERTLHRLDRLEGHPDFYRREPITIKTKDARVEAVIYLLPLEWLEKGYGAVPNGVWEE
jgi:gamma-glutamylcyclotransferase (GGCT)/AIG2-like uncharacterized protein YtfP